MKYHPSIGLEIHSELKTKTEMFCGSLNDPNEQHPNVNICPVCLGHPGTLPVINKEAVRKVLLVGSALEGEIADYSEFSRKNYFYPDLPKGYQISQYQYPLIKGGFLILPSGKKIKLTRIHLEEDTGRLIHPVRDERAKDKTKRKQISNGVHPEGADYSLVDFNRAGVPLMELVTEPDISSAAEARMFAEEFQLLLRYLGVSDAEMEKGQLRAEVNISLLPAADLRGRERGTTRKVLRESASDQRESATLGTKVEIKNLNSFRSVERAIDYEIKRQAEILDKGEKIVQETRGWDEAKQKTVRQRFKEESHDYRYFPEPDLPPMKLFEIEEFKAEGLKAQLPELPWQKRERFKRDYGLEQAAEIFVRDKAMADYFEQVVSELMAWEPRESKEKIVRLASNYLVSDLQGLVKEKLASFEDILITPENFAELMKMLNQNEISSRAAKDILRIMFEKGEDPHQIVEEGGLKQVSEEAELKEIIQKIIEENPAAVSDYKKDKKNALEFLVGKAMAQTKGRANPEVVREIFRKLLS